MDSSPGEARPQRAGSDKARVTAPVVSSDGRGHFRERQPRVRARHVSRAARRARPGNFIFSQTSISTALAMLYAGAGTTTAAQMADDAALHPARRAPARGVQRAGPGADHAAARGEPRPSASRSPTRSGSRTGSPCCPPTSTRWPRTTAPGFSWRTSAQRRSPRAEAINGWVADRTEEQIPALFPQGSINTLTRLVLANAVFFHGDWKMPFTKDSPNETFHALTGDVSVPTMHGSSNAAIWSGTGWNAAALDYVGDTAVDDRRGSGRRDVRRVRGRR